ncbi:N-acetylglucosamine kinase [Curtobacterium sp. RRHDQ10]|uniref:N-acetylglucosamine kinase n=1 Tax=Curtobacterium phyllosphaerae TaxID=3413379 RepID=UPI003BF1DA38
MTSLWLGVDGGGTKTDFLLADDQGRTVAETRQPSCYYFDTGLRLVSEVLGAGVRSVTGQAGIGPADIAFAHFGLPGYGEASQDTAALDAIPAESLGHHRYTCGNDMVNGWAGSLAGADGVNVIAGTGSMAYGERDGLTSRVGGWSEVFGDEGSAYWIATRGLAAFSRMADGRLPRGPLYGMLRDRIGVTTDLDVIGVVVDAWGASRTAVADLAKVVTAADEAGDDAAAEIVRQAVSELALLVTTAVTALQYGADEVVPVSWSGGVFSSERFRAAFADELADRAPECDLRAPVHGPSLGSVLYAMRQAGATIPVRLGADAQPGV